MAEERNKFPVQMTRKGLFVSGLLILFIMGWMFVLGILVGRGTAPLPASTDALEKELDELKAAMPGGNEELMVKAEKPAAELGFYEALKNPPERQAVPISPPPEKVRKPPPPSETPRNRPAPAPEPSVRAAKVTDASPKTTRSIPPADPAPAAPAAGSAGDRYTVQLAAFKDSESAETMVAQLRARGYPSYSLRTEIEGKGAWYRVRVGAFEDRTAARKMLEKLKGDSFEGFVVGTR